MTIQGIDSATSSYSALRAAQSEDTKSAKTVEAAAKTQDTVAAKAVEQNEDKFVKATDQNSVTYAKPRAQGVKADQLMNMEQQRMNSFTEMLRGMVAKQGQQSNLTMFGLNLNVTPQQSADAATSIAPGGEYSVDAVAGRLIDMAKALAGGDSSKISALRTAVEKGFKAAGVDFGGKLPSISQDTHTEVMKRFDQWEQESRAGSVEPSR